MVYNKEENIEEYFKKAYKIEKNFKKIIGEYSWSKINIVKINFIYGGMEYPHFVIIGEKVFNLKGLIIHEITINDIMVSC